jgi:hypothetical protein
MIGQTLYKSAAEKNMLQQPVQEMEESILAVLAYFDIFYYPLTLEEIKQFRQNRGNEADFHNCLKNLISAGIVFQTGDLFSVQNNPLLAYRRKEGNQKAGNLLAKATNVGRFLQRFPFVRAVGISGSLSKNFADRQADFDFFIITHSNRLWIARTLMHLYKKCMTLFGRQHYFCMNYYIDEEALTLDDRNVFTAIELKTLLPVSGWSTMSKLFASNNWTNEWLPNCPYRIQKKAEPIRSPFKRFAEWVFDYNKLDDYLFRLTSRRWKNKESKGKKNSKGQIMKLHTDKHFSKSNPGAFQEKVLAMYDQKLEALKIKLNLSRDFS